MKIKRIRVTTAIQWKEKRYNWKKQGATYAGIWNRTCITNYACIFSLHQYTSHLMTLTLNTIIPYVRSVWLERQTNELIRVNPSSTVIIKTDFNDFTEKHLNKFQQTIGYI